MSDDPNTLVKTWTAARARLKAAGIESPAIDARLMLEVASGARTRSEIHGIGADEFVPWSLGAVM